MKKALHDIAAENSLTSPIAIWHHLDNPHLLYLFIIDPHLNLTSFIPLDKSGKLLNVLEY